MVSLKRMTGLIKGRKEASFMSMKVKSRLRQICNDGINVDKFLNDVAILYSSSADYLEKWIRQFSEFECFSWMLLSKKPLWSDCEECLLYLQGINVPIDDVKMFDQFTNLCNFVEIQVADEGFGNLSAHEKWAKVFPIFLLSRRIFRTFKGYSVFLV